MRKRVWLPLLTMIALLAGGGAATVLRVASAERTSRDARGRNLAGNRERHVPSASGRPAWRRGVLPCPSRLLTRTHVRRRSHTNSRRRIPLAVRRDAAFAARELVSGQVYLHQLTIVEGWRFRNLRARARYPAIARTLDGAGIMTALGEPGVHPEGQFFPDTYIFARDSGIEVLRRRMRRCRRHLRGRGSLARSDTLLKTRTKR